MFEDERGERFAVRHLPLTSLPWRSFPVTVQTGNSIRQQVQNGVQQRLNAHVADCGRVQIG